MVRTRSGPSKVSAGKTPGKQRIVAPASIGSPSNAKPSQSNGNSYHPRETPSWQKSINTFFKNNEISKSDSNIANSNMGDQHESQVATTSKLESNVN